MQSSRRNQTKVCQRSKAYSPTEQSMKYQTARSPSKHRTPITNTPVPILIGPYPIHSTFLIRPPRPPPTSQPHQPGPWQTSQPAPYTSHLPKPHLQTRQSAPQIAQLSSKGNPVRHYLPRQANMPRKALLAEKKKQQGYWRRLLVPRYLEVV